MHIIKKEILIGLFGMVLLLGAGVTSLAASKGKVPVQTEAESETEIESESEMESESETETESESESEDPILYAPDLTLQGIVVGGYAGTITVQTDDGEEYVISYVDAKTDFSDSGLYDGMAVKCILEDIASDEDGVFTAREITTDQTLK